MNNKLKIIYYSYYIELFVLNVYVSFLYVLINVGNFSVKYFT